MFIPIYFMISHLIMAAYASVKLVATRSKKLTVPLIVFTTIGYSKRVMIGWMLTRKFFPITCNC